MCLQRYLFNLSYPILLLSVGLTLIGCGVAPETASLSSPATIAAEATSCTCSLTGKVTYAYQKAAEFSGPELETPAGLVFHPDRRSLFIAGKHGQVLEMDLNGQLIRRQQVMPNVELAAIAYSPGVDLLYLAQADGTALMEVEPATLRVRRKIELQDAWPAEVAQRRPESLTFIPEADQPGGGLFYLAARSGPGTATVLALTVTEAQPAAQLTRNFMVGVPDLVDMVYEPANGTLLAISDSSSLLFRFNLTGRLVEALTLPSENKLAIAIDDEEALYIGESSPRWVKYQPEK